MPDRFGDDPPSAEDYLDWYEEKFADALLDSKVVNWYQDTTDLGKLSWKASEFWKLLPVNLERWKEEFGLHHQGYPLMAAAAFEDVHVKPLESVINKSYRWNVLDNPDFPNPPVTRRRPSAAPQGRESDREDRSQWYGPGNWLSDFPDIFRTRLVVLYFDGVRFLADELEGLARRQGSRPPDLDVKASHTGYHAMHVGAFHRTDLRESEHGDSAPIDIQLEMQVITFTQNMIMDIIHGVYAEARSSDAASGWEWDSDDPAFSANYLGNTLHYLEGMIVTARNQIGRDR